MTNQPDFSHIRNLDDLMRCKQRLRGQVDRKEALLKRDIDRIQQSFSVLTSTAGVLHHAFAFSRSNWQLFLTGFRMARHWFGRGR